LSYASRSSLITVRLEFCARNGQAKTPAALEEYSTIRGGFQKDGGQWKVIRQGSGLSASPRPSLGASEQVERVGCIERLLPRRP